MINPEDGPDYRQAEELEARRFFEEAQELLIEDAEAYHQWLDMVSREERDDA